MSTDVQSGIVFLTRDNEIVLELREDDVAVNIVATTRATLELHDRNDASASPVVVDSLVAPAGTFDWSSEGASGKLKLKLGPIALAETLYAVRLVLYDAVNDDGILWTHETTSGCNGTLLELTVVDAAA